MFQAKITLQNGSTQMHPLQAVQTPDGLLLTLKKTAVPADFARIDLLPNLFNAAAGESGYYLLPHVHGCRLAHFTPHENAEYCLNADNRFMPLCGKKSADKAELLLSIGMRDQTRFGAKVENNLYSLMPYLPACELYEDITLLLFTLPGANADYSAMARCYRNYLLKNGICTRLSERAKLRPVLSYIAQAPEIRIRLGWKPAPSPVAHQTPKTEPEMKVACTFADVERLIAEMQAQGIAKADLCLVGWNKSGHDGRYPQIFPVEEKLGGEAGLRRLIAGAKALGYLIDAQDNYTDCYTVSPLWDNGNIACLGTKGLDVNGSWCGGKAYNLCLRNAWDVQGFMPDNLRRTADLGFWGSHYIDVFSSAFPYRCLNPGHAATRPEQLQYMIRAARLCRDLFGGFSSECCGDWLVGYLDYINYATPRIRDLRAARAAGRKTLVDKVVPFWELAFHDVVLSNPDRVTQGVLSPRDNLLLVEFGGRPIFYSFHDGNIPDIVKADAQFRRLRHLQLEAMTRHDELAPGLVRVAYGNGETIYVNHTERPQTADGLEIPAQDFRLVGSGRAEQTSNGNNN